CSRAAPRWAPPSSAPGSCSVSCSTRARSSSGADSRGATDSTARSRTRRAAGSSRTTGSATTSAWSWTWRADVFTGLIEEQGRVARAEERPEGRRLWIAATLVLADAKVGDSINCSGCCLTAVGVESGRFAVEAVPETLRRTTLGDWREGTPVNLERSLRLADRLGGHLVQGHVDGVGEVRAVTAEGDGRRVALAIPRARHRFGAG